MKKHISNKKLIGIISIALILSFSLIYFFTCPSYNTVRALKNGNITEATTLFSKVDSPLQRKLFLLMLPSTLEDINDTYNVGELSLQEVEEIYETVVSFDTSFDISEQHNLFKELALSKQSYESAKKAMNDSNYLTAISNYKDVLSIDSLYDTAQQELENATNKYKSNVTDKFYEYVLKGNIDDAEKIIDEAITVLSDDSIRTMKANLKSGVYDKICTLLNNASEWEIITQAHAGENTYCCYSIKVAENNSNAFECYYVTKSLNSLVQSGNVSSVGGPVAWYRLSGEAINKLTYNEEKRIEAGGYAGSVGWDYTMTRVEKFKKLEKLFS